MKVEGRKPNLFEFYAKTHPILYKDSERREQRQTKNAVFNVCAMPSRLLAYEKIEKCSIMNGFMRSNVNCLTFGDKHSFVMYLLKCVLKQIPGYYFFEK